MTSKVFSVLINIDADETAEFVAQFANSHDSELAEAAILALGDSNAAASLNQLIERYDTSSVLFSDRQLLLRAIALHRHEDAIAWQMETLRDGSIPVGSAIIENLAQFKNNHRVQQAIAEIMSERNEAALESCFLQHWDAP